MKVNIYKLQNGGVTKPKLLPKKQAQPTTIENIYEGAKDFLSNKEGFLGISSGS